MATSAEFKKLIETGVISKLFEEEFKGKIFSVYPKYKDKDCLLTFPSENDTPHGDEVCRVLEDYLKKEGYLFENYSRHVLEQVEIRIRFPDEIDILGYITATPRFQRGGFKNMLRLSIVTAP